MTNLINHKALEKVIVERIHAQLTPLIARIEELESLRVTEYLTKTEAAKYIRCSTSTIDNYVKRGLPKYTISKGKVLFRRSDIDNFLSQKRF